MNNKMKLSNRLLNDEELDKVSGGNCLITGKVLFLIVLKNIRTKTRLTISSLTM